MRKARANKPIAALCGIVLAALALTACGKTAPSSRTAWGDVVVRVGRSSITKATLEHWTAVEAVLSYQYKPKRPVPRGVVPDPPGYDNCIAYLAAIAKADGRRPTTVQLRRQCEQEYERVQHHILEILITDDWIREEAIERGIKATRSEVDHVLSGEFVSKAAFGRFLVFTGERAADERYIIEGELLVKKLYRRVSAGEVIRKWTGRTNCRAGYVISACRQYNARNTT